MKITKTLMFLLFRIIKANVLLESYTELKLLTNDDLLYIYIIIGINK